MPKGEISEMEAREEKAKAERMLSEGKKRMKEEALKEAVHLEKEEIPSPEEMTEELEKFAEEGEQAKKLLTPWYIKNKSKKKK